MGHRGQVAYFNEENVSVHYTHWGGDGQLVEELTEETPFGSENHEPEYVTHLISELGAESGGFLTKPQDPEPVKREPMYVCGSLQEWHDNIKPIEFEGVYTVDTADWSVRTFKVVYVSKLLGCADGDNGKFRLVEITDADEWDDIGRVFQSVEEIEERYDDRIWTP